MKVETIFIQTEEKYGRRDNGQKSYGKVAHKRISNTTEI